MINYTLHYTKSEAEVAHLRDCDCNLKSYIDHIEVEAENLHRLAQDLSVDTITMPLGHCITSRQGNLKTSSSSTKRNPIVFAEEPKPLSPSYGNDKSYNEEIREAARLAGVIKNQIMGQKKPAARTSHTDCEHETTKAARATCRRQREKAAAKAK